MRVRQVLAVAVAAAVGASYAQEAQSVPSSTNAIPSLLAELVSNSSNDTSRNATTARESAARTRRMRAEAAARTQAAQTERTQRTQNRDVQVKQDLANHTIEVAEQKARQLRLDARHKAVREASIELNQKALKRQRDALIASYNTTVQHPVRGNVSQNSSTGSMASDLGETSETGTQGVPQDGEIFSSAQDAKMLKIAAMSLQSREQLEASQIQENRHALWTQQEKLREEDRDQQFDDKAQDTAQNIIRKKELEQQQTGLKRLARAEMQQHAKEKRKKYHEVQTKRAKRELVEKKDNKDRLKLVEQQNKQRLKLVTEQNWEIENLGQTVSDDEPLNHAEARKELEEMREEKRRHERTPSSAKPSIPPV